MNCAIPNGRVFSCVGGAFICFREKGGLGLQKTKGEGESFREEIAIDF